MTAHDFVLAALKYQCCPYIWRGKGLKLHDVQRGLVGNPWARPVFDCSGLVTVALKEAGGPDWRADKNASVLAETLPPLGPLEYAFGDLLFFAAEEGKAIDHVAISLGYGLVLESSGGGSTTTTPQDAEKIGAKVRVWKQREHGFVCAARIPFDSFTNVKA